MQLTPDEMAAVGARIRTLREAAGLRQAELADDLHVGQPAVSQWERGTRVPSLPVQHAIANRFGVERAWLFSVSGGCAA